MSERLAIAEEITDKRAFAWVIDWPGWCRTGRDAEAARAALASYAPRYRIVAADAGATVVELSGAEITVVAFEVIESVTGGSGTDFGVPSRITGQDRLPVSGSEATRLAGLVSAAWGAFDRVAAVAPAELRKGPRGGGRDRDKMIGHVVEADHAYARELGVRHRPPAPSDRSALEAERSAVLEVLRRASDGSPVGDRTWTPRYAARRIAWHALDHAWEMEDRAGTG